VSSATTTQPPKSPDLSRYPSIYPKSSITIYLAISHSISYFLLLESLYLPASFHLSTPSIHNTLDI